MWKFPKIGVSFCVVILVVVFLLVQENLWIGVTSSASSIMADKSSSERIGPSQESKNGGSRSCCFGSARVEDRSGISQNERVKRLVYEEYAKKLNDPTITVEVNDLGCHIEALVIKDGKALKHLSVSEGKIQEVD